MKIVISVCFGGFGLSAEAIRYMANRGDRGAETEVLGLNDTMFPASYSHCARNNPLLVEAVEHLGTEVASGRYAKLKVVEVDNHSTWRLDEYDGRESIEYHHPESRGCILLAGGSK